MKRAPKLISAAAGRTFFSQHAKQCLIFDFEKLSLFGGAYISGVFSITAASMIHNLSPDNSNNKQNPIEPEFFLQHFIGP